MNSHGISKCSTEALVRWARRLNPFLRPVQTRLVLAELADRLDALAWEKSRRDAEEITAASILKSDAYLDERAQMLAEWFEARGMKYNANLVRTLADRLQS